MAGGHQRTDVLVGAVDAAAKHARMSALVKASTVGVIDTSRGHHEWRHVSAQELPLALARSSSQAGCGGTVPPLSNDADASLRVRRERVC